MAHPDVCVAGAGIIGLSLARALARAGMRVVVLTSGAPMTEASHAAAGMLAVEDPDNPPELLALSRLSRSLYSTFLDELAEESGERVSFQTQRTLQLVRSEEAAPSVRRDLGGAADDLLPQLATRHDEQRLVLEEKSVDPRELAKALVGAVASRGPALRTGMPVVGVHDRGSEVAIETAHETIVAGRFVDCTGAWSLSTTVEPSLRVVPRKGQMLTIATPPTLAREELVVRSHQVYLVPRLHGERAGQCVVGATVEDAGFDRTVHRSDLAALIELAAEVLPELRSASILESWAGLRPATADLLPALGRIGDGERQSNLFVASGHYRNGILLAPGSAAVMTNLLLGRTPAVSLAAFAPARFRTTREMP